MNYPPLLILLTIIGIKHVTPEPRSSSSSSQPSRLRPGAGFSLSPLFRRRQLVARSSSDESSNTSKPEIIRGDLSRGEGLVNGEFISSKVKVSLSCEPEETVVKLNFTEPFKGVVQSGDNHSPCRIRGNGRTLYELRVPHTSCGTRHVVSSGSFFNTLFIRYHPSLEMEGDQLKSIVCKFGTGSLFVG